MGKLRGRRWRVGWPREKVYPLAFGGLRLRFPGIATPLSLLVTGLGRKPACHSPRYRSALARGRGVIVESCSVVRKWGCALGAVGRQVVPDRG
jgi:hypothetical protein